MFDTMKIVDMLRAAGFDEKQARTIADVQKHAVEEEGLATKADVAELKSELKADIARLEGRIDGIAAHLKMLTAVVFALFAMNGAIFIKISAG